MILATITLLTLIIISFYAILSSIENSNEKKKVDATVTYPFQAMEDDYTKAAIAITKCENAKDIQSAWNLMKVFQFKYGKSVEGQIYFNFLCELWDDKQTKIIVSELDPYLCTR